MVHVDAHLAPDLARAVDRVRRELVAAAVEGRDVVGVGRADQLLVAVAVEVGHRDVLVVHPPAVAGLAVAPRGPAGADVPGRVEDAQLLRRSRRWRARRRSRGSRRCRGPRPPASAPRRRRTGCGSRGRSRSGRRPSPGPSPGRRSPRACRRRSGRPRRPRARRASRSAPATSGRRWRRRGPRRRTSPRSTSGVAVAVEVGDRGRGVPAGLTPRAEAAAALPLQDGRGDGSSRPVPGPGARREKQPGERTARAEAERTARALAGARMRPPTGRSRPRGRRKRSPFSHPTSAPPRPSGAVRPRVRQGRWSAKRTTWTTQTIPTIRKSQSMTAVPIERLDVDRERDADRPGRAGPEDGREPRRTAGR